MSAPKEIWIYDKELTFFEKVNICNIDVQTFTNHKGDIKYLSEDHVKDLLAEKDKEIENIIKTLIIGRELVKEWCVAFDSIADERDEDFLTKVNEIINNHNL